VGCAHHPAGEQHFAKSAFHPLEAARAAHHFRKQRPEFSNISPDASSNALSATVE
jgi:hypothetical protein